MMDIVDLPDHRLYRGDDEMLNIWRDERAFTRMRSAPFRKSEDLLLSQLDSHQIKRYMRTGYFLTRGSDGRIYEVNHNGVRRPDRGWGLEVYPVVAKQRRGYVYMSLPYPDKLLAIKLLCETDMDLINRMACRTHRSVIWLRGFEEYDKETREKRKPIQKMSLRTKLVMWRRKRLSYVLAVIGILLPFLILIFGVIMDDIG